MNNSVRTFFDHTMIDPLSYGDETSRWLDFVVRQPGQPITEVFCGLQGEAGLSRCHLKDFGHLIIGAHLYISTREPFDSRQHYFATTGEVLRWRYTGYNIDEMDVFDSNQVNELLVEIFDLYAHREPIQTY